MPTDNDSLVDIESQINSLALLATLLSTEDRELGPKPRSVAPDASDSLVLFDLVESIASATGADEVVLCIRRDGKEEVATFPADASPRGYSTGSSFLPVEMTAPILVSGERAGFLGLRGSSHCPPFTTVHKKLVMAISGYLGLRLERKRLAEHNTEFAGVLSHHFSCERAIHSVWRKTENRRDSIYDKFKALLTSVSSAMYCDAMCVVYEQHSARTVIVPEEDECCPLHRVLTVLVETNESNPAFYETTHCKWYDDVNGGIHGNPVADLCGAPRVVVLFVPFTRLLHARAILVVVRTGTCSEFDTTEKATLESMSGYISE